MNYEVLFTIIISIKMISEKLTITNTIFEEVIHREFSWIVGIFCLFVSNK